MSNCRLKNVIMRSSLYRNFILLFETRICNSHHATANARPSPQKNVDLPYCTANVLWYII